MEGISSGAPTLGNQMNVMKKATEVQAQQVMKMLDASAVQTGEVQKSSGAELTGLGKSLDIKA